MPNTEDCVGQRDSESPNQRDNHLMRIIAGVAKGRRLVSPGKATRPFTGKAKESLFSSLGTEVIGARVLDLFAGSGSLGLEALSRGAASVVFVEHDRAALAALQTNIDHVALGGTIVRGPVSQYLGRSIDTFDLAFVDPPYALPLASVLEVVERLESTLVDGALVVVHRRRGDNPPETAGSLHLVDQRSFGDADIWRYRKEPA